MNTWPFPSQPTPAAAIVPSPRMGAGTRLTSNYLGYVISASSGGETFDHPWRPALGGGRLTLRPGTVGSLGGDGVYEPKIKVGGALVPMSGDERHGVPALVLEPGVANAAGESWAVLEVEPDSKGELVKKSRIEIVHTATPFSHTPTLGRHPLVQILWRNRRPFHVLAITHFNLRYVRKVDPIGTRHFFL
jgi:hypothetical protein